MSLKVRLPLLLPSGRIVAAVSLTALIAAQAAVLAPVSDLPADQAAQGWIRLFDGSSRFGLTADSGDWQVSDNNTLSSDSGQASSIRTDAVFADFDLKFEARLSGGPATLLLRVDPQSKPAQSGAALSLANGSIAGMGQSTAPASSPGAWNTYEVRAEGSNLTVNLNGRSTADGKDTKNRIGYFEFTVPKGTRLELRSVVLQPLGLDRLYSGSNLDGWKSVAAPAPQNKSKLRLPIPGLSGKPKAPPTVRWSGQGTLHGEGGVGQLESSRTYDDFVLQFSAKAPTPGTNGSTASEIFFRGTPNQFDSGYSVSTGSFTDQQKRSVNSPGLGGLIGLQLSRTQSVGAGQFYVCTVVARAHRLSVWINGTLVTDYYDSRPEGPYHSAAGPLGFRIKEEKAVVDIRNVAAEALPKGAEPIIPPPPPAPPTPPAAVPTVAPPTAAPIILPGQSPQDKAQQEQIRKLTADALGASNPEDAVRINKQILFLAPGDMPAQQRLDKAQGQIDATNALRQHGEQEQQANAALVEANSTRRNALIDQARRALLSGRLGEASDRLNDAHRLGANDSEFDRLQGIVASRIRNRLLTRIGLGCGGVFAVASLFTFFWRRRGKTLIGSLIALDGADKGKRYLLNQEVTHLGGVAMDGGKKNEVLVRDPDRQVSRFHCEIHMRGNHYFLIDLDSSNGTFLHSRRLQPGAAVRLRDGDKFTLARAASFELRLDRQALTKS
jgi:hypothetical protein